MSFYYKFSELAVLVFYFVSAVFASAGDNSKHRATQRSRAARIRYCWNHLKQLRCWESFHRKHYL